MLYKKTNLDIDSNIQNAHFHDGDCAIIALCLAKNLPYNCVAKKVIFLQDKFGKMSKSFSPGSLVLQEEIFRFYGGKRFKIWRTLGNNERVYLLKTTFFAQDKKSILLLNNDDEKNKEPHCVFLHNGVIYDTIDECEINEFYSGDYIVNQWIFP